MINLSKLSAAQTKLLEHLVHYYEYATLHCPPCLEPSPLLTQLEAFFAQSTHPCPVVRLNLGAVTQSCAPKAPETYERAWRSELIRAYSHAGLPQVAAWESERNLEDLLLRLSDLSDQHELTFLLDVGDIPLWMQLGASELSNLCTTLLYWLFSLNNVRFALILSYTPFQPSLALRYTLSVNDNPDLSALVGLSADELTHYYAAPLSAAAQRLQLPLKQLLAQLSSHYGGWRLGPRAPTKLYAPAAIEHFFQHSVHGMPHFAPSWPQASTTALQAVLAQIHPDMSTIEQILGGFMMLDPWPQPLTSTQGLIQFLVYQGYLAHRDSRYCYCPNHMAYSSLNHALLTYAQAQGFIIIDVMPQ